ncbi:transposase [Streptomyces sp. NPDC002769]|uniref:transposase n=1 Tax=Streptomyces sp. NPDC002769 TaxID=3154542 RepID=UPI00331D392F
MAEKRRKFDPEFREGAVRIVTETGKTIAEVAEDLHPGTSRKGQLTWAGRADRRSS